MVKFNKFIAGVALFSVLLAACDTDVEHNIAQVAAPEFQTISPESSEVLSLGKHTITLTFDKNIFFASSYIDKLELTGAELVSAEVMGSSNQLIITANFPERDKECTLTIPEGVITGPNKMPVEAMTFTFKTCSLDKNPVNTLTTEAMKVYTFLQENYESKIISGMMANVAWNTEKSEQVYQWTGKYPAINCFDYVHLQSSPSNWIDYSDITPVKNWSDNGGVVSIMWHWNVPVAEGSTSYAFYAENNGFDADKALVEGSWENKVFTADLEKCAGYLKLLKDANIPVLWRPFHEASGGWFWWGRNASSEKAIWIYMFDFFKSKGLNNLIWIWTSQVGDKEWYPGDQYVDIVGCDIYNKTTAECAAQYSQIIKEFGNKIITLSECGSVGKISEQWASGGCWSWFMPWYDNDGAETLHADKAWWEDAMKQSYVITRDKLPSFK